MSHRHHAEFLTPARLERLAKHAQDVGDERVLAACRAAPIDAAALRDVAVACERALHEPMSDGDREGLSPGIRLLVEALDAAGFRTTDSGDGTNWAAGMECALPYRHVAVSLARRGETILDHGDDLDPDCRFEVSLAIAGERWFAEEDEARGALGEVMAALAPNHPPRLRPSLLVAMPEAWALLLWEALPHHVRTEHVCVITTDRGVEMPENLGEVAAAIIVGDEAVVAHVSKALPVGSLAIICPPPDTGDRLEHWRDWSALYDPFPEQPPEHDNERRFRVNAWIEILAGEKPREGRLAIDESERRRAAYKANRALTARLAAAHEQQEKAEHERDEARGQAAHWKREAERLAAVAREGLDAARAEGRAEVERELESGLVMLGLRPGGTTLLDLVGAVGRALGDRRVQGRRDGLREASSLLLDVEKGATTEELRASALRYSADCIDNALRLSGPSPHSPETQPEPQRLLVEGAAAAGLEGLWAWDTTEHVNEIRRLRTRVAELETAATAVTAAAAPTEPDDPPCAKCGQPVTDERFAVQSYETGAWTHDPCPPVCTPSTYPNGAMERMSRRGDIEAGAAIAPAAVAGYVPIGHRGASDVDALTEQWSVTVRDAVADLRAREPNDGSALVMRVGADGLLRSHLETDVERGLAWSRERGIMAERDDAIRALRSTAMHFEELARENTGDRAKAFADAAEIAWRGTPHPGLVTAPSDESVESGARAAFGVAHPAGAVGSMAWNEIKSDATRERWRDIARAVLAAAREDASGSEPAVRLPAGDVLWLEDGEIRMGLPADATSESAIFTVLVSARLLPFVKQALATVGPPERHRQVHAGWAQRHSGDQ